MKPETTMTIITVLALLIMGIVLVVAVLYPNGFGAQHQNAIYVSAQGFAYGAPQQAVAYLTINGSGATAEIATANVSLTLAKFNASVKKYVNGNMSMVKTVSYSLYLPHNSTDYVATEGIQVNIPNIQNASSFIGNMSTLSNLYISQVSAQLSNQQIKNLTSAAIADALQNATAQARSVSRFAGNKTIMLANVTINSYRIYPYYNYASASSGKYGNPSPEFFSGTMQVAESVSAVFSYK
ncbi:MAG: SIMPL domain-containing protein [Candidatus Micrarchaeota archaeon]|nr:SIMPL domain-containing protein [Candidatus Micrarchaeota archaeon]MDE1849897.1 SIMPL domain-containing protein [Candidatus Micrarchaeota archaeon]